MVGKKNGEVTPWSAHLHPRILPNGWPPIPISAMVKLHMCCHPTLGPTSSVYNFLWIQIDDHQKRNWVEKNQPFDDVCFYFPYSSSWIYHQKSPFFMVKSNVLTMAHIIQGAEWGPRPTSRCSPLVVKVPWTTPLSAWCLWENQWLKINLDPSKKWMFTGTYPSVNRVSMDMDMEHPQFLGHRGNPWISVAISNYKLSLYPLLTDQYTAFDGVSWFGHYSVIFSLVHLLCAPTNSMLWCYKLDINHVWSPVKWMH